MSELPNNLDFSSPSGPFTVKQQHAKKKTKKLYSPRGPQPLLNFRFSRPPPRFPFPPPRFSRPPPRISFPPPRISFPSPLLPPRIPPPSLPSSLPVLPSTSKGIVTPAATAAAPAKKSPKKVSFSSDNGNNPPLPPTPSNIPEEPAKPFKLSEKTRAHLQLQMQEIAKRYEMRDPEESTWVPLPTKLWEKLANESIHFQRDADADDGDDVDDDDSDERVVTPSTSSGLFEAQNTEKSVLHAYQKPYDILIDDPFQKDANINYAERYPNLTNVRALRLYQPADFDDDFE